MLADGILQDVWRKFEGDSQKRSGVRHSSCLCEQIISSTSSAGLKLLVYAALSY
jgi:hypothetical protein